MGKSGKRRVLSKKPKQVSHDKIQNVESSINNQSDISTYFLKLKTSPPLEDAQLPEVPVPSPDDAALPSSTCLGSVSNKDGKEKLLSDIAGKSGTKNCVKTSLAIGKNLPDTLNIANNKINVSKKKSLKQTGPTASKNRQLTDFFPIRRSNRKTLYNVMKERLKIVEDAVLTGTEDGYEIKEFPNKGRGVISVKSINRGDFVLEYYGELIDTEEAKKRELIYATKEDIGCYMYYFKHNNKSYCIDATKETDRLGRLINHSKKGNLKTHVFFVQDCPRLVFIACKDIHEGEELLYDYGDRSKLAIESHPWLAL